MSYASEVLADAPAVYYQGQETSGTVAVDSSGNGRNGTYGGTIGLADTTDPALPTGLGGNHVRLNGTNAFLQMDSGTWLTPATTGFTVEGWFYFRSFGQFARLFDFANGASSSDIYYAPLGNNGLGWLTVGGVTKSDLTALPTGSWRHVVMTVSSAGVADLYVDGVLYAERTGLAMNNNARANRYIGKSAYPTDPYLAASMAHVATYSKVLSPARVAAHFNAIQPTTVTPAASYSAAVLADNPLAWYRLGEANGSTTLVDSSGNARHGTYSAPSAHVTSLLPTDTADAAFDASSAIGTVPYGTWADVGRITLETWLTVAGSGIRSLVDKDNEGTVRAWQFRLEADSRVSFVFWASDGAVRTLTGSTALTTGGRYHLAVTYDGTVVRLYVNGAQDAAMSTPPLTLRGGSSPFWIAAHATTASNRFLGTLDEFAYYGTALSPSQVATHYVTATSIPGSSGPLVATIPTPTLAATGTVTLPAISGTVAASIPAPTLATAGTYTPVGIAGTIAATIPAPTLVATGGFDVSAITGTFTGTIPAPTLDAGNIVPPTGTSRTYANEGYAYDSTAAVEYEPAVTPTPPHLHRADVRTVHVHLPTPTLVNGRPQ